MKQRTFKHITEAIKGGGLCIVELTVGVNTNNPEITGARAQINLSSNNVIEGIQRGVYDGEWLNNIAWVAMPLASQERRLELNHRQENASTTELQHTESPLRSPEVLNVFGMPDFHGSLLEEEFMRRNIPIFFLKNEHDNELEAEVNANLAQIENLSFQQDQNETTRELHRSSFQKGRHIGPRIES